MRNRRWAALAAAIALGAWGTAQGEIAFEGSVVAGETLTVTAPFGGTVSQIALREGQLIAQGDAVAQVETTKIYAPMDGTIRGIFAQPGDSAEETVLYLAPVSKYTISATVDKAYNTAENKFVRIGETVYIICTADGSHLAEGVITAVNGKSYTVETTKGELYMEEKVYLCRRESRQAATRIGSGTVGRTAETALRGSGSLLRLWVTEGEEVERGQLLFETVEGALDGLTARDKRIFSTAGGVVAGVSVAVGQRISKGDALLTVYPTSGFSAEFEVPESQLAWIREGSSVTLYFEQQDEALRYKGTVTSLAYAAREGHVGTEAAYTALAAFQADENIRLGMSVTVVIDEQTERSS